ncbi:hypothetical protein [Spartinivicinus ruber]|uniref:hypothetical protein n=1 Tax=Spartinivicinus ruber TaxID=2683272 RepID=UPI0013D31283|nr:hypothetical protein [Spartinivicinus ruber]
MRQFAPLLDSGRIAGFINYKSIFEQFKQKLREPQQLAVVEMLFKEPLYLLMSKQFSVASAQELNRVIKKTKTTEFYQKLYQGYR